MSCFKSCPKCLGQMFYSSDHYGKYWTCIQCGLEQNLLDVNGVLKEQLLFQIGKLKDKEEILINEKD